MSAHAIHESDELDLLDIAVALAEWWRSFLIVPLAAAAVGYVAGIAMPVSYTATLKVPIPQINNTVPVPVPVPVLRAAFSASSSTVRAELDQDNIIVITARAESAAEVRRLIEAARSHVIGSASDWVAGERQSQVDYVDALVSSDNAAFLAALTKAAFDMTEIHAAETFIEMARGGEVEIKKSGGRPVLFAVCAVIIALLALVTSAIAWSGLLASANKPGGEEKIRRIKRALKLSERA